jgi:expansin (peptidoglycan-binding protein)
MIWKVIVNWYVLSKMLLDCYVYVLFNSIIDLGEKGKKLNIQVLLLWRIVKENFVYCKKGFLTFWWIEIKVLELELELVFKQRLKIEFNEIKILNFKFQNLNFRWDFWR